MPRYNGGFIGTDGLDAPDAPTIGTPSAGSTEADIAFTAGAAGTTATTEFVATTNDGIGATGTSSPITITGLTNGTSYTARVYAKNSHGTSAASEASASFTPLAEVISGLFSTYLYDGTGSAATINNGINLSGKGGLVWIKDRDQSQHHALFDTSQGATKYLKSSATSAVATRTDTLTSFNSNGFSLGNDSSGALVNSSSQGYVSWTFRKQPKFFDIVTYTGNGTAGRTISHNLGSVPGFIIVKRLNGSDNWTCYHRGVDSTAPEDYVLYLNDTAARSDQDLWADTAPTSSVFSVGDNIKVNGSSSNTYVAYLFAHNDGDGGFGPDSEDIIKCGSFTGTSSGEVSVNLGFEPQFILYKLVNNTNSGDDDNWRMHDVMRGWDVSNRQLLNPNQNAAESSLSNTGGYEIKPTATGFIHEGHAGSSGSNYIYMAIRRGGMSTPTAASDVFHVQSQSDGSTYSVGFPTDLILLNKTGGSSANTYVGSRLTGNDKYLVTSSTAVEASSSNLWAFDLQNSFDQGASTSAAWVGYHWARARGYFDVVTYTGNSTNNHEIKHNLKVAPEMVWTKQRTSDVRNFVVYHSALGNTNTLALNTNGIADDESSGMHADPTASSIFLKGVNATNGNNQDYIAYLFATAPGVSKVGSYTGNGSTTGPTIDCGFSGSPSFVLIKKATGGTGSWAVFDSARGIVAGNESQIYLNSTGAAQTATDQIDPTSSGFQIVINSATLNSNGETYIFYAIAATS